MPILFSVVVLQAITLGILVWKLERTVSTSSFTGFSMAQRNWRRFWTKHRQGNSKSNLRAIPPLIEQIPVFHHAAIKSSSATKSGSLDGYYSRHSNSAAITAQKPVPFLIVGGSDGSGTRAFVQTLMDLGVTMVADAWNTMDIHGEEMVLTGVNGDNKQQQIGWPPLVQLVLNATHSANYDISDLPSPVREKAVNALQTLKASLLVKGKEARLQYPNPKALVNPATGVQYGWKAPISMVLLPLLQHVMGPIKFVHVVRDGRDVALSENQSPVNRYYRTFFQKDKNYKLTRVNQAARAMRLWSDWNWDVWEWEQQSGVDYMVVRTEDLLNSSTRFELLAQLADFVGARVTVEELCCLSQRSMQDLGDSSTHQRQYDAEPVIERAGNVVAADEHERVQSRYGKWAHLLEGQAELLSQLNKIGAKSLRAFGYEPKARFLDNSGTGQQQSLLCQAATVGGQQSRQC
jgi:hypothetical protein